MLDGQAHGPGTWVDPTASKRMEGIWSKNHFCVGIGTVEFNDGTKQKGLFVNGKYKSQMMFRRSEYLEMEGEKSLKSVPVMSNSQWADPHLKTSQSLESHSLSQLSSSNTQVPERKGSVNPRTRQSSGTSASQQATSWMPSSKKGPQGQVFHVGLRQE